MATSQTLPKEYIRLSHYLAEKFSSPGELDVSPFYISLFNPQNKSLVTPTINIVNGQADFSSLSPVNLSQKFIDEAKSNFEQLNSQRVSAGKKPLTPGQIVSLQGWSEYEDKVVLDIGVTTYDMYLYLRGKSFNDRLQFKDFPNHLAAAVITLIKGKSNQEKLILLGERNPKNTSDIGQIEIPGGGVALNSDLSDTSFSYESNTFKSAVSDGQHQINPTMTLYRELFEERGIRPEELDSMSLLGCAWENYRDAGPTLVGIAHVNSDLNIESISTRPTDEESKLLTLNNDPFEISNFLLNEYKRMTNVTIFALLKYLASTFGDTKQPHSDNLLWIHTRDLLRSAGQELM